MKAQRLHAGDLVHIKKNLPDEMSHFEADADAIVIGSYADQYGGNTRDTYTVFIKGRGESAWYDDEHLKLIERNRPDVLAEWKRERDERVAKESDLDWIFAHGSDVVKEMKGASILGLAASLGITEDQMWGKNGEGFVFYENSLRVLAHAAPFLEAKDKDGWLKYAADLKAPK